MQCWNNGLSHPTKAILVNTAGPHISKMALPLCQVLSCTQVSTVAMKVPTICRLHLRLFWLLFKAGANLSLRCNSSMPFSNLRTSCKAISIKGHSTKGNSTKG